MVGAVAKGVGDGETVPSGRTDGWFPAGVGVEAASNRKTGVLLRAAGSWSAKTVPIGKFCGNRRLIDRDCPLGKGMAAIPAPRLVETIWALTAPPIGNLAKRADKDGEISSSVWGAAFVCNGICKDAGGRDGGTPLMTDSAAFQRRLRHPLRLRYGAIGSGLATDCGWRP